MSATTQGLDVSLVKTFLRSLREGRIYIARITSGGRNGRYSYLIPPLELLKVLGITPGTRFSVKVDLKEGYVEYIVSEKGEYKLTPSGRAAQIRFPINSVRGYVVIEPMPHGFRVYFA